MPLPHLRRQPAAALRRLPGIERRDHRRVGGVPRGEEFRSTLFNPSVEVRGCDLVRPRERLLGGREDRDRRILLRYFFRAPRQLSGKRRPLIRHELLRVVEDDHVAAGFHVVDQPVVVGLEVLADCIGARARHDGVVRGEIAGRQVAFTKQRDLGAQLLQADRDLIANAHHVSHPQSGRGAQVDASHLRSRCAIEVSHLEVAVVDDLVSLPILVGHPFLVGRTFMGCRGDRFNRVGPRINGAGPDREAISRALARSRECERL